MNISIPYRDLSVTDAGHKRKLLEAVDKVLTHGRILLGPEVDRFEEKIAGSCDKRFAVGVASGTDALFMTLRALGIGPGDEVITTPLSWIATLNAIVLCGATPVFVDVGNDLNIDAALIEGVLTSRTRAIVPVHYTGKMCPMDRILSIANAHNLFVIEDAAQAFGAAYQGKPAGSFGHAGCFSMNPMKVLCAYGEAGVVVTDDEELREKLVTLRYAGMKNKEDCIYPSLNGKIDTIQAAMLMVEMDVLEEKIKKRRQIAGFYHDALKDAVECPDASDKGHSFFSYTILAEKRDQLKVYLQENGIETKIHSPIPMPCQTAYRSRFNTSIPNAERVSKMNLSIPNHEKLSHEEAAYITDCIRSFYR